MSDPKVHFGADGHTLCSHSGLTTTRRLDEVTCKNCLGGFPLRDADPRAYVGTPAQEAYEEVLLVELTRRYEERTKQHEEWMRAREAAGLTTW